MGKTSIEWTDRSVNPIRAAGPDGAVGHYCEMISGGCAHCYSSNFQPRFGMPKFKSKPNGAKPFFDDAKLKEVLSRKKPTKWFWCDMTDLFGSWVPDEWIDKCFAVMALTSRHVHQVLTKRPERMHDYVTALGGDFPRLERAARSLGYTLKWSEIPLVGWPLNSVWLGTSCEDQQRADERIPLLLKTPAAVRFVSAEPLLTGIDFSAWLQFQGPGWRYDDDTDSSGRPGIDWVIAGGESGPGSRMCKTNWVRSIIGQCQAAGVACFVKQLGAFAVENKGDGVHRTLKTFDLSDKKGGDMAEWPEDLQVRQFPREVTT